MKHKHIRKVVAVLPAYNAARTLLPVLKSLKKYAFDEIILVDDCSKDSTFDLAQEQLDLTVFQTPHNLGYGGNIKLCFEKALESGAEIIVEIHPDGEYLPDAIPDALTEIEKGAKLVLGNRFTKQTNPLKYGMFWWKHPLIQLLNVVHNILLRTNIPDLHQGFRVYSRELLKNVPFNNNSNDYAFTFEIILQALFIKYRVASVPVMTHYVGIKRGASLKNCVIYSLETFKILGLYYFSKLGIKTTIFTKINA